MGTVVIVAGALANKPFNGGEAWVRLSWALGLRRLGFRVYFVEQIARETCVDADGAVAAFEQSVNLAYFREVTGRFGLGDVSALVYAGGEACAGMGWGELLEVAGAAELLVNISGHLALEPVLRRVRRMAYVDIDPGFTQFWHVAGDLRLAEHDFYFTIGENVGRPDCAIPAGGVRWRPTRQPVVLGDWPVTAASPAPLPCFTTVANWRGPFGPVEYGGRRYGLKVHEFRKFLDLPGRVPQATFELALNIHPADAKDAEALRRSGWRLTDPAEASKDPDAFRRYVQDSAAEFSVAQGVYVDTNSGWFSDRTVRYLASGRPALVQETGFGRFLPTGRGLVPFRTPEDAAAGARAILDDYPGHCAAARRVAEECFDSDKVLRRFADDVGVAP